MASCSRSIVAALVVIAAVSAEAAEPLVSAEWVRDNYDTVLLDVRHVAASRQASVPGAVHTNYGKDGWRIKKGDLPGLLPPVDKLEKLVGRLGISNADHVVVLAGGYGASEMGVATRIYWTFKVLGHDGVSILDGGMQAYFDLKNPPLSRNNPPPARKTFTASPRWGLVATDNDVAAAVKSGIELIDKPPERPIPRGQQKRLREAARHSTRCAQSARHMADRDDGGHFWKPQALKTLYAAVGVSPDKLAIAFCNTGHWASLGWFVSRELMGNDQVKLYDGSMAQWTRQPENPVERAIRLD